MKEMRSDSGRWNLGFDDCRFTTAAAPAQRGPISKLAGRKAARRDGLARTHSIESELIRRKSCRREKHHLSGRQLREGDK